MSGWGLAEVRAFAAAHLPGMTVNAVKPLSGGYWNEVLRLDTDQGRKVLKRYRTVMPGTLFPNLPDMEAEALRRLAGLDVAPALTGFWPHAHVVIYDYAPGDLWSGDVSAVAELLRRKEAADPSGFRSVPAEAPGILAQGDGLLALCRMDAIARRLHACRPTPVASPAPRRLSLIHTDIGAGNLIGSRAGLRLIDWQCPAKGDLAEDAFSFLSPAFQILNLHPVLSAAARAGFFAALADPALESRLALLEPSFAWRMAAYCCRRMQTAKEPEVRARYREAVLAELARLETRA